MNRITLISPDDWHCHLRDGEFLQRTVPDQVTRFKRSIIMPNLNPPVTTVVAAKEYLNRITDHISDKINFQPLMTLYLTENMSKQTIIDAKKSGFIFGCKLYPAGATTHSAAGIQHLQKIYPLLEVMQEQNLVLQVHGESIDPKIDLFDREAVFIDQQLIPLLKHFPNLRVVLEHISTKKAAQFVHESPKNLAATITVHHLLLNRNDIFRGGIHPHYYCLPILKCREDQEALIAAAISGHANFFLGTDSAPHAKSQKESCCGRAGIYTAYGALELYAEVFAQHHALDRLEGFASIYGPQFYQLPINQTKVTLVKKEWVMPKTLGFGSEELIPLRAGETMHWSIDDKV